MLKAKIHRARVTHASLHYVGSLTVDATLLKKADLLPGEKVDVVDIDNGVRLSTYLIEGAADSGIVAVNGAAARLINVGDLVIVINYALVAEELAATLQPRIVFVDECNRLLAEGLDPADVPKGFGLHSGSRRLEG